MMKLFFDNFDLNSNSGPNSFGRQLLFELKRKGHQIDFQNPEIQLSFIQIAQKNAPKIIQRCDGIYHNSAGNYLLQNQPIQQSYNIADGVIIQSQFDKKLINSFFGERKKCFIINNGTDLNYINSIPSIQNKMLDKYETIWTSASMWAGRGHKRLNENIRFFLEHSSKKDCLIVMGEASEADVVENERIIFTGTIPWANMISIFKRAKYMIHTAFLDHCPNVVIDARACGCHIICSNSGGTPEIAGYQATIIEDAPYDFTPIDLYSPPPLDFSRKSVIDKPMDNSDIDIKNVAEKYIQVFKRILK